MSDPLADFARTIIVLAADLEAEIMGGAGDPAEMHPVLLRRFNRDMKPVRQARELLRSYGFDQWTVEEAARMLDEREAKFRPANNEKD